VSDRPNPPIGARVSWPETNHGATFTRGGVVYKYELRPGGSVVAVIETQPGGPLMELAPHVLTLDERRR